MSNTGKNLTGVPIIGGFGGTYLYTYLPYIPSSYIYLSLFRKVLSIELYSQYCNVYLEILFKYFSEYWTLVLNAKIPSV